LDFGVDQSKLDRSELEKYHLKGGGWAGGGKGRTVGKGAAVRLCI